MGIKQILKELLPDDTIVKLKNILNTNNNMKMVRKHNTIESYAFDKYPFGINLIGDIKAETGLGQSMRILADIIEKSGIPFCIKQINSPGGLEQNVNIWQNKIEDSVYYSVNLIHINPNTWAENYNSFPDEILNYRYNIAYWLWELEDFPDEWVPCIDTVDEVWTPSEFISKSIRNKTCKPVTTVPYSIKVDTNDLYGREYFGLQKKKFLFLTMYDLKSISERKNPKAVIEAYKKAFSPNEGNVGLVIKINHINNKSKLNELKQSLDQYKNVYYITDNLSRQEVESLIASVDVLVSLHRSEGFGLPLAEAMYVGTPVIATNWSANTEFMSEDNACLVKYKLIKIVRDIGPYKKGNSWADANIDDAALHMRKLFEDKEYYKHKSEKSKIDIKEILSSQHALDQLEKLKSRLTEGELDRNQC